MQCEGDPYLPLMVQLSSSSSSHPSSSFLPISPLLPSPLTQLLCIITEKEEDVAAFKDYQEPPTTSPPQEKVFTPHTHEMHLPAWCTAVAQTSLLYHLQAAPEKDVFVAPPPSQPATPTNVPSMPLPPFTRVFVSPYARSILAEQGRSADNIRGTGYSGAVTSRDVIAAVGDGAAVSPRAATGSFTEVPLTGMRKVGGEGRRGGEEGEGKRGRRGVRGEGRGGELDRSEGKTRYMIRCYQLQFS